MGDLDERGEQDWDRLREQIHLSDGFWLGFVFSYSPPAAAILRERAAHELRDLGRRMVVRAPSTPDELRSVLPWLLTDAELEAEGCVWVESIVADAPHAKHLPWLSAWDQLFLRANEHRDALRRRLRGGLVFAATTDVKPRVREAAPDLWSVRSLVIEEVRLAPRLRVRREPTLHALPSSRESSAPFDAPDPVFAMAEARRRDDAGGASSASHGLALLDAAEGLLAEGKVEEALMRAASARDALQQRDMLGETRAMWVLARAELARGDLTRAGEHVDRAVALRATHAPSDVPIEWYDLAGKLALARGDRAVAAAMYTAARRSALTRLKARQSLDVLESLLIVLIGFGDLRRAEGDVDRAIAAFESAVAAARKILALRPSLPRAVSMLSFALLKAGDARSEKGDLAGAIAAFDEARQIDERLCEAVGHTPEALRMLSVSMNRLGNASRDAGDVQGAARRYEAALSIRRRLVEIAGESAQALRGVSSSLLKLGELRSEQGDLPAARTAFEEALAIDRKLHRMLGDRPETLRDLAISLHKGAGVRLQQQDPAGADALVTECLQVAERLQGMSDQPDRDQAVLEAARDVAARRAAQGPGSARERRTDTFRME